MSRPSLVNPYAVAPEPPAARRGSSGRRARGAVVAVLAGASAVSGSGIALADEPPRVGIDGPDDDRSWQCFDAWVVTMDWVPDRVDIANANGSTTRCEPDRGFEDGEDVPFLPGVTVDDLQDTGDWACEPTPRAAAGVQALSAVVVDGADGVDSICRDQDDLPPLPPDIDGSPDDEGADVWETPDVPERPEPLPWPEPLPMPEPPPTPEPEWGPPGPDDDRGWRCVDVAGGSEDAGTGVVVIAGEDGSTTRCVTGDDVPAWLEDVPETGFLPGVEVGDLGDDWSCAPVPEPAALSARMMTTVVVDDERGNDNLCRYQDGDAPGDRERGDRERPADPRERDGRSDDRPGPDPRPIEGWAPEPGRGDGARDERTGTPSPALTGAR